MMTLPAGLIVRTRGEPVSWMELLALVLVGPFMLGWSLATVSPLAVVLAFAAPLLALALVRPQLEVSGSGARKRYWPLRWQPIRANPAPADRALVPTATGSLADEIDHVIKSVTQEAVDRPTMHLASSDALVWKDRRWAHLVAASATAVGLLALLAAAPALGLGPMEVFIAMPLLAALGWWTSGRLPDRQVILRANILELSRGRRRRRIALHSLTRVELDLTFGSVTTVDVNDQRTTVLVGNPTEAASLACTLADLLFDEPSAAEVPEDLATLTRGAKGRSGG